MRIKLVTLEGCNRCANLKKLLSGVGIDYVDGTCEQDPQNCDALESLVDDSGYPMVLISDSVGNLQEVLYITTSYNKLKAGKKYSEGINCIPFHSIDNIVDYVKNKLN